MIDTCTIEHVFYEKKIYNDCYRIIDRISSEKYKMRLHTKNRKAKRVSYITMAFKYFGFLEIKFFKYEFGYAIRILLKPSCLLYPGSELHLSSNGDFSEIRKRFNAIITSINNEAGQEMLPFLENWKVMRIDYAFDIYTAYTGIYLRLFHLGLTPKGFKAPQRYTTSFYMKSKRTTYNFYDKIDQVKKKHAYKNSDIEKELGFLPQGILRIEIQCKCKAISYMKKKYSLKNSSIYSLWNPLIAIDTLKSRIKAVIGKENFCLCKDSQWTLSRYYKKRTFDACMKVLHFMENNNFRGSLQTLREFYHDKGKRSYFNTLIYKIRNAGVNPIPLDCSLGDKSLDFLENPYYLVTLDEKMAQGSDALEPIQ